MVLHVILFGMSRTATTHHLLCPTFTSIRMPCLYSAHCLSDTEYDHHSRFCSLLHKTALTLLGILMVYQLRNIKFGLIIVSPLTLYCSHHLYKINPLYKPYVGLVNTVWYIALSSPSFQLFSSTVAVLMCLGVKSGCLSWLKCSITCVWPTLPRLIFMAWCRPTRPLH